MDVRKFIEEHEWEALLILITMLGIARWWIPGVNGFENMYGASHWALSYDYGLIRRGLIGSIVEMWVPIVSVGHVHHFALAVYCTFLAWLVAVIYYLLRFKDKGGRLFRLILLFVANPVTLALLARNLGRFDLFLVMITFLSFATLSFNKHFWLIPVLMLTAMFIHEGFLILWAPTILAAMIFVYFWEGGKRRTIFTFVASAIGVAAAFIVLYKFGHPALGYEEFASAIQSRAAFSITELSMRECFFSITDHVELSSSSLLDAGSIVNFLMALLMLSPVFLVLLNLWSHAIRNSGAHRKACWLLVLATLSGLILIPIATDYGRWLSAIVFCNFFALFFLVSRGVVKVEELVEYAGGTTPLLFVSIVFTYLLFGPFHDWNPYPYKDNLVVSAIAITAVLLIDIGMYQRWRKVRRA